jgi:DNA-binding response OmpR family regulator
VDDDLTYLEQIDDALAEELDVVSCTSAEQALKILATIRFHLVCADFSLPGMNGLELLERVSQLQQTTSGLLLTGCEDYPRVQGLSRYHVILKPFDRERLLALVLQLARLTEMKRSVQSLTDSVMPPESSRALPPSSRRFEEKATESRGTMRPSRLPPAPAHSDSIAPPSSLAPSSSLREEKR